MTSHSVRPCSETFRYLLCSCAEGFCSFLSLRFSESEQSANDFCSVLPTAKPWTQCVVLIKQQKQKKKQLRFRTRQRCSVQSCACPGGHGGGEKSHLAQVFVLPAPLTVPRGLSAFLKRRYIGLHYQTLLQTACLSLGPVCIGNPCAFSVFIACNELNLTYAVGHVVEHKKSTKKSLCQLVEVHL